MQPTTPDSQSDFILRDDLRDIAPFVADLIDWEAERQARKLILIPSESYAPKAVRQALGSVFQNVYAEGYPPLRMTRDSEERLHDVAWQLAHYRRYADRRFYKGVDYVDFVECLAQRRCAKLFSNDLVHSEHVHVNVQPLSGAAANLAVYWALMDTGDTLMGLDLFQGGHLTHGSEFNVSGERYRVVSYGVDPKTERFDYDAIAEMAREHRPRVIVAGYTAYPWAPDWQAFRAIADQVGAYLVADISHTAGLVAAGAHPNPVGAAHVTTLTTHKTLCGPRAAVILTTDEGLARAIDTAIFPGEQGGPHINKIAALAVAFEIADCGWFRRLQHQIVANAKALADALQEHGIRLAYGGTDTHLMLLDLKSVHPATGCPLWGEPAVRILDLAGIVANKNTIPGDTKTALATGIRIGTPWITQRGLDEADMETLAGLIYRVLTDIKPFAYNGLAGTLPRGKIAHSVLKEVRRDAHLLAEKAGIDFEYEPSDYPHYELLPENPTSKSISLRVTGWRARQFVQEVTTADLARLLPGESASAYLLDRRGHLIDHALFTREEPDKWGQDRFLICPAPSRASFVASWLRGLSDGYIHFDDDDIFRKIQGPVVVEEVETPRDNQMDGLADPQDGASTAELFAARRAAFDMTKPYFIGQAHLEQGRSYESPEEWQWRADEAPRKCTPLYETHIALRARMVPFAGWEMPIWYTSVSDEHRAVRETAGLFDVSHMGTIEVEGPDATSFLDAICTNYVAWLEDGQSCYSFLLDPRGQVIDDVIVYRRRSDRYLMVVNAANEEKDWDWLNAVNERRVVIDADRPWVQAKSQATIRNLKDPAWGKLQKRDVALQGPASLPTLQSMTRDPSLRAALARVRRTNLIECELAGLSLMIARTGYTGEKWGYEILVHPDDCARLWQAILDAGKPFGVKPAGLAARDSTRIEAGLPLYGHELAGPFDISPISAGFPGYVKYHKPFFVGRGPLLAAEQSHTRQVVRFRVNRKGVRRPNLGDSVVSAKGQLIGHVTSCSIDLDGYLLGLAFVEKRQATPGTPIGIFPLGGKSLEEAEMVRGKRVALPVAATVLTRFPEREGARARTAAED